MCKDTWIMTTNEIPLSEESGVEWVVPLLWDNSLKFLSDRRFTLKIKKIVHGFVWAGTYMCHSTHAEVRGHVLSL